MPSRDEDRGIWQSYPIHWAGLAAILRYIRYPVITGTRSSILAGYNPIATKYSLSVRANSKGQGNG
jgi:hypothetical protein